MTKRKGEPTPVVLPETLERQRIVSVEQAATFLGYSTSHLRRLYRSGRFEPPIRLGERKGGYSVGFLQDKVAAASNREAAFL